MLCATIVGARKREESVVAKRETLVIIAGIVWIIAGVNVARLGFEAFAVQPMNLWVILGLLAGVAVTFLAFHAMFSKLVGKNVHRIAALQEERVLFLRFLNLRSWCIMGFMITFGFWLRSSGFVPEWGIAFFYTGLGVALALAGVGFLIHRVKGPDWTFHRLLPVGAARS